MPRQWLPVAILLATSTSAIAQNEPLKFQWQAGQALTYSVKHVTTVTETTIEEGTNKLVTGVIVTKLDLVRRWDVTAVDQAGIASLSMTITAIKQQLHRPGPDDKNGKPTVISTVADSATPEGLEQFGAFMNKPIVTVKLDRQGQLVEAKAAGGMAERLSAELPFRLTFPAMRPVVGSTWDRTFAIKLDPPTGTGESYTAVQTYTSKGETAGVLTVGIATALKAAPKDPALMPALVSLLWTGEVTFDPTAGRYTGAKLNVKQTILNHQGEGTKFEYESEYVEAIGK